MILFAWKILWQKSIIIIQNFISRGEIPPRILCIKDALACIESTPMCPVHSIIHVWALLGWRDCVIVAYVNCGLKRLVPITWQWVFELKFEDTTQCMLCGKFMIHEGNNSLQRNKINRMLCNLISRIWRSSRGLYSFLTCEVTLLR